MAQVARASNSPAGDKTPNANRKLSQTAMASSLSSLPTMESRNTNGRESPLVTSFDAFNNSKHSEATQSPNGFKTQPYFFGKFPRGESERLLTASNVGVFLVRESESQPGEYSLSVRDNLGPKHYRLQKNANGYFIEGRPAHATIGALIEHHKQDADGLENALTTPCTRPANLVVDTGAANKPAEPTAMGAPTFQPSDVGKRVTVQGYGMGTLRFVGPHAKDGKPRCGVELDEPKGLNNGTAGGHKYFECPDKHGVLADPRLVTFSSSAAPAKAAAAPAAAPAPAPTPAPAAAPAPAPASAPAPAPAPAAEPPKITTAHVGHRCTVEGYGAGKILFVGPHAKDSKPRVGVRLDEAKGLNNGTAGGHKYFECEDKHGVLADPRLITLLAGQPASAAAASDDSAAKAKAEAEAKAKADAEAKAKAKAEADAKAEAEAEARAKAEAERRAKADQERAERDRTEAEQRAKREAEQKAREAEQKEREEQEARERKEAFERAKAEAAAAAKAEEERREAERREAEERARAKAEEEARLAEEARQLAEEEARIKAEEEARIKAEEEARQAEAARKRAEAEAKAKAEAEEKARAAAAARAPRGSASSTGLPFGTAYQGQQATGAMANPEYQRQMALYQQQLLAKAYYEQQQQMAAGYGRTSPSPASPQGGRPSMSGPVGYPGYPAMPGYPGMPPYGYGAPGMPGMPPAMPGMPPGMPPYGYGMPGYGYPPYGAPGAAPQAAPAPVAAPAAAPAVAKPAATKAAAPVQECTFLGNCTCPNCR
eukprot:m.113740 g.113740  ORF g.113740 m.113740 type:complete len:773 (+) comp9141_c2_seq1:79-2397(+)